MLSINVAGYEVVMRDFFRVAGVRQARKHFTGIRWHIVGLQHRRHFKLLVTLTMSCLATQVRILARGGVIRLVSNPDSSLKQYQLSSIHDLRTPFNPPADAPSTESVDVLWLVHYSQYRMSIEL